MPEWVHMRAKHILAKNPDMDEGLAFALSTQQSHALNKSPKGYGTEEGREEAKAKYDAPKSMKRTANPGRLKTEKLAFIEALPTFTGLAAGYGPGRSVAGQTAAAIAPEGRVGRSEDIARSAAVLGAPLGGLGAMALAKKYRFAPRLAEYVGHKFPAGIIADPSAEQELVSLGIPGAAAIGGSLVGGGLTGGVVGGLQRLRGPTREPEKVAALKPSPMWSRIGGASSKKPLWMAQSGFTPTGFKTPAQRLSKSMDMGKFDSSKGLKPLDFGKMQQAVESAAKGTAQSSSGVKLGFVLLAITKSATGQPVPTRSEREDAETGDENEPQLAKAADDGGHGGFSTNAYSGVMNPPAMVYKSGIPPWQEPPVKTAGPPTDKTAEAGITPLSRLNSAQAIGAPRLTSAPGPSIAQIAKPKGYGTPMSGAKKGNNII